MDSYCIDGFRYTQLLDRLMQVWIFTGKTDAGKDRYWIDCCMYGYVLKRLMQVWTARAYTDADMDSN